MPFWSTNFGEDVTLKDPKRNFRFTPVGIKVGDEIASEGGLDKRQEFNDQCYAATLKDYHELREMLFPGTAPPLE